MTDGRLAVEGARGGDDQMHGGARQPDVAERTFDAKIFLRASNQSVSGASGRGASVHALAWSEHQAPSRGLVTHFSRDCVEACRS